MMRSEEIRHIIDILRKKPAIATEHDYANLSALAQWQAIAELDEIRFHLKRIADSMVKK